MPSLVPSIHLAAYYSGAVLYPEHTCWCNAPAWQTWINAKFVELEDWFEQHPPDTDAGALTLTLKPWTSGTITQPAVEVRQNAGETVDDFLARAKRTFKDALEQHPPD